MIEFDDREYLDTEEAADYLLITTHTMRRMRSKNATRNGPPYTKYMNRTYYKKSDLDEWMSGELENNKVDPNASNV